MNRKQVRDPIGCAPEDAATVGGVLRGRRLARGLTIEDVAGSIRFSARHVLAVEQGRFGEFPPPPYGRGLISAYADLVGVEPEALLQGCARAFAAARDGGKGRIFRLPIRERLTWRDWTVPFALTIAFVAIVAVRAVVSPEPAALDAPAQPVAAPALTDPPAEQAMPLPESESASAPEAPPPGPDTPTEPSPPAAPGVRVVLLCEGTTWAEAATDGGEPRRYELGPGQVLELVARERIALSLGDAGVVRVRVGERELGLVGDKGETRTGMSFVAQKPAAVGAPRPAGD